ncbi:unnamed protein product [Linum trigynum]|uniref:Uncharacterized protein n=1 Tax=Linum trigynum TaxID=586398 RepID=A0AAV2GB80_9ROSI
MPCCCLELLSSQSPYSATPRRHVLLEQGRERRAGRAVVERGAAQRNHGARSSGGPGRRSRRGETRLRSAEQRRSWSPVGGREEEERRRGLGRQQLETEKRRLCYSFSFG